MFGKKAEKNMQYNIKRKDEDYSVSFFTKIRRNLMLRFYKKMQRKAPTKESFDEIERDGWIIKPEDGVLFKRILGGLSKKLRKQVKEVEMDVRKDHPNFRILSHSFKSIEFIKDDDHYKIEIKVKGICV